MEDSINSYLEEITAYLKDNFLLIHAPKSSVTLFTPDTHQAKSHPKILIEDSQLHLVQCPKILGVHMDISLSFNKHSSHVAERVSSRNNILNALAGTSWGQQKETLLMAYNAVGRSIINYAALVWCTNLRDTNYRSIQYEQNEALRISKMSSVDHLHAEAIVLKVRKHSELLSAQYLARCLEPENVNNPITTRDTSKRRMEVTLFTRHLSTVEPMMIAKDSTTPSNHWRQQQTTVNSIQTIDANQPSVQNFHLVPYLIYLQSRPTRFLQDLEAIKVPRPQEADRVIEL